MSCGRLQSLAGASPRLVHVGLVLAATRRTMPLQLRNRKVQLSLDAVVNVESKADEMTIAGGCSRSMSTGPHVNIGKGHESQIDVYRERYNRRLPRSLLLWPGTGSRIPWRFGFFFVLSVSSVVKTIQAGDYDYHQTRRSHSERSRRAAVHLLLPPS